MQIFGSVGIRPFHTTTFLKLIVLSFLFVEIAVLFGCHSASQKHPAATFGTSGIKRVLVLPFRNMTLIFGENVSIRSPISGKVFVTGSVDEGAEGLLTRLLSSDISNMEYYELIPAEQAEGIVQSDREDDVKTRDERYDVTQIGRRLGADAVLVGHVYRFKELVGSKYAADSPASVAFDVNMVGTRNGELLWSGHIDETQQSLNENLFLIGTFLKRGGAWVTAEQMAAMGLDELVQQMPRPQLEP